MKKFNWEYLFVLLCVAIFGFSFYKTVFKGYSKGSKTVPGSSQPAVEEKTDQNVFPTKTPEEIEVISQIETHNVEITKTAVTPASLTIKPHDQVAFFNKTDKVIKIEGKDWGNIPLQPEENMTQAFKEKGSFDFKVTGLEKELNGKIVVE